MRKELLFIISLFVIGIVHGQQSRLTKIPLTKMEPTFQKSSFETVLFSTMKNTSGIEFKAEKNTQDKLKQTHTTYQQYYKGIKVEMGMIKLHQKDGVNTSYNGVYFDISGVSTSPQISKKQVISIAQDYFNNEKVFWLTEEGFTNDPSNSIELIILPNRKVGNLNLAYAIGIGTKGSTHKMGRLYIDAINGKVLKFKSGLFACFEKGTSRVEKESTFNKNLTSYYATGSGYAAYTGSVNFETKLDGSEYVLNDETRATGNNWNLSTQGIGTKTGIITLDMRNGTDYVNGPFYEFTDNDNNWTPVEMIVDDNIYAIDAHWGTELIYDYWKEEHSWNSYNGSNSAILSLIHYDNNLTNAAWAAISNSAGFMLYGDGAGSYSPLTTLDVVAHEIAHGINNATSNLDYELESGALNEGLSDIWAMVIENYANDNHGTTTDPSRINDQNVGGALRSFSNPNAYNQPDTYGGTYWYDVTGCTPNGDAASGSYNDYCGVHTNSGVLNHWFWLLYNGGSGTNDLGDAYMITAIDVYDAAAIVWQMQSNYLTVTSDYADARAGAIQAAVDLFGTCSQQEQSVTNAFYAVGVGTAYIAVNPAITSQPSDVSICEGDATSFSVSGSDYDSLQWQVDDGSGWSNISNDSTYSGATSTTLTITNPSFSMDAYGYRMQLTNNCSTINSNTVALDVDEYPVASVAAQNETCTGGDGTLTFTFLDNSTRSNIEFSIDGGANYDYNYEDTASPQTISSLTAATYNVWVRWGNDECPLELGDYIIALDCYTAIPDANFEAALDALGYDDIPGDGQVPTALIEVVSTLDVQNSNISDLTGIEDFVALQVLYFSNNNVSSVDLSNFPVLRSVRAIENNLATFDVTHNPLIDDIRVEENNIAAIDLSNNPSLEILQINGNELTVLDISNNPLLRRLRVYNNNITELDLTNNTVLTQIQVQVNDLLELNMRNGANTSISTFEANDNPNLACIKVDDASYSTTNWTTIDATTNFSDTYCRYTLIPDSNFESVLETLGYDDISGDGQVPTANIEVVTSLDLNSKNISDITGIEDFIALQNFSARSNSFTAIDISNNVNISTLDLFDVNLTEIDLTALTNLQNLSLSNNSISAIDISNNILLEYVAIQNCTSLTAIDLSQNVALERLSIWGNALQNIDLNSNTSLTSIVISQNNITAIDLSQNILLEEVLINENPIVQIDVSWLTNLVVFEANDCDLSSLNIKNGNNTSITYFSATSNADLNCIVVDVAAYSAANWTNIDNQAMFNDMSCDFTPPAITLLGENPQTIELGVGYTELGATTDDGSAVVIDNSTFVDAIGNYTIRYNATNASGNVATEVIRMVNVVDTTAPVITLIGDNPQTIELGVGYTELGANIDDGITNVVIDSSDFIDAVGNYTIRYNATDASGNVATEVTRTIHVVDTTAPVISLVGDNPQVIELGAGYTELGAIVDDGITNVIIDSSDFVDAIGNYTIRYNATDASGNVATEVTRTINVVDTTVPVITLTGDNPQTIELGAGYTELGAIVDDGITNIVIDSSDFVDAIGNYTIRYNATDTSGNVATEVTRTVHVVDTTVPVITLIGDNPQTIELGVGYSELGAIVDDGITNIVIDSSDFVDAIGNYTIRYNATDASGNVATEVTRTVHVVDTTVPVITLTGDNSQTIELGTGYTELGATVDDVITNIVIDSSDFIDAVGNYTIRYNATDASGNVATEVTRTVDVVDTTNPTLVCQNITVQLDDTGNVTITADQVDNGTTDLSGIASLSLDISTFDCATIGDNLVTLTATDTNGNSNICNATVTVEDSIAPVFNATTLPSDTEVTFDTGDMHTLADFTVGVEVTDNCDTNRSVLTSTITQNPVAGTLLGAGDHMITLTATDANSNKESVTFTITVSNVLSVEENEEDRFTLYPNPAKQQFQVSGFFGERELSIHDVNGRILKMIETDNNQFISIEELPNGLYFVRIAIGTTYQTIKLLKNE
ncbi:immunoglobulin-like domain-containing protein [uncultured Aquimarina sp.]|uniref:immunoglobulin-like domain-containing protein n=1 Tax=uncultured Aquimarina sp. TaxID=575652 RepID=UPI00261E5033|nr:immunoglobulin-like domain-containing protein [uncultured Aquimarina sp.]